MATSSCCRGGLHPKLDIVFYEELFRELKRRFRSFGSMHSGRPKWLHIARISRLDPETVLLRLIAAGLDSLPGAGAEILDNGCVAPSRRVSPMPIRGSQ